MAVHEERKIDRELTRRSVLDVWRGWRRLSWPARRTYLAAASATPLFAASTRLLPLTRLLRLLSRAENPTPNGPATAAIVRRHVAAMSRVARHGPYRGECLSLSMALVWLLRLRRVRADLHLGVRLVDGRLDAHAWVEHDGLVLTDGQDVATRFARFWPAMQSTADAVVLMRRESP